MGSVHYYRVFMCRTVQNNEFISGLFEEMYCRTTLTMGPYRGPFSLCLVIVESQEFASIEGRSKVNFDLLYLGTTG